LVKLLRLRCRTTAISRGQVQLAHAQNIWSYLDAFIITTEFQCLFQGKVASLRQGHGRICGSCTHIGQLLFLGDVDVHVFIAVIGTNDNAFVCFYTMLDEEVPTIRQLHQYISGDLTGTVSNQRTGRTSLDFTSPHVQAIGQGVRNAGTTGFSHESGAETDQATRWNTEGHAYPVAFAHVHGLHLALAVCHQLSNSTLVFARNIDGYHFIRLMNLAINNLSNNLWLTHGQLKAFTTHGLNQNRQSHLATALNFPCVRALSRQNAQGHVTDQFLIQTSLDHTCGQLVAAALASQW